MSATSPLDTTDHDLDELDNAGWISLTTRHARFAETVGGARRYPTDVSPFCAVDTVDAQAWDDLARLAGPGGTAVLFRADFGEPPTGWTTLQQGVGHQMVATELRDVPTVASRRLEPADVDQMLELIAIAQPGPFARRTIEMGDYVGAFDGDQLVAMAGERLSLPAFTEVSAVCTHPDARGRGLGAGLTGLIATRILGRGQVPFLHVADGNPARSVYERIGFSVRTPVRFAAFRAPGGDETSP